MNINKLLCHESNYTKANRTTKDITTIVIHYTGNKNDKAISNCKYFQSPNRKASAHYFVDETSIYQSVEDKDISWNASVWEINQHCIGIEMCNSVDSVPQAVKDNVRELVQFLMKKYPNINKVIRHYDCNGKKCPLPLIDDKKWKEFKEYILKKETKEIRETVDNEYLKAVDILVEKGIISSPSVWKEDKFTMANTHSLIIKLSNYLVHNPSK